MSEMFQHICVFYCPRDIRGPKRDKWPNF